LGHHFTGFAFLRCDIFFAKVKKVIKEVIQFYWKNLHIFRKKKDSNKELEDKAEKDQSRSEEHGISLETMGNKDKSENDIGLELVLKW
jgi:hypothetical protein